MKAIAMILLAIFMAKGCSQDEKNDLANTKIVYSANTRGFYQKITVQNQEVSISNTRGEEGEGKTTKISDSDWNQLVSLFSKIDLEKLNTYEGPTKRRFHDGAAMANILVTCKDSVYESTTFDHGTPPVEIAEFVNKIAEFGKVKEE